MYYRSWIKAPHDGTEFWAIFVLKWITSESSEAQHMRSLSPRGSIYLRMIFGPV